MTSSPKSRWRPPPRIAGLSSTPRPEPAPSGLPLRPNLAESPRARRLRPHRHRHFGRLPLVLDTSHGTDYFRRCHAYERHSGSLFVQKATHPVQPPELVGRQRPGPSSFGRLTGADRRYPAGTENLSIFFTLSREIPKWRRRALAHAVPTGETHLPIKLHGVNAPALPVARKGQTAQILLRPQRDHHAATMAEFCTAVSNSIRRRDRLVCGVRMATGLEAAAARYTGSLSPDALQLDRASHVRNCRCAAASGHARVDAWADFGEGVARLSVRADSCCSRARRRPFMACQKRSYHNHALCSAARMRGLPSRPARLASP